MKKIYLSVMFLGIGVLSFSQYSKVQSHRAPGDVTISLLKNGPAPKSKESNYFQNKVDYLSENFEGTFPPAGWTVNSGPLSTVTDPDQEWHKEANGGYPENSVAFTTSGTLQPGGCASILYVNSTDTHDENLVSPTVTLPATPTRLVFNFATSYYWHVSPFDNADIQFSISTDGGTTWNLLWQEDDDALLQATGSAGWGDGDAYGWFEAMFDLSQYAGQDVKFNFNFMGLDGAPFYVDNFVVQDIPANDLKVTAAYTHDVFAGYDYTIAPLMQVGELAPIVIVKNGGSGDMTDIPVSVVINDGTSDVYTGSQNVTLTAGMSDTLTFASGITPTGITTYKYVFSLPDDEDNANNTSDTLTFMTSNDIYAHDSTEEPGVGMDEDAEHSWGCVYEITSDQTLNAANVIFGDGTTATQVGVFLSRFDPTGNIQAMEYVYDFVYNVPAAAINSGNFAVIPFPQPQLLEGGYFYVLEVRKNAGTDRLYIGSSSAGDDDQATVSYGPWGTNSAVNYYSGWNVAMAIRMNFSTLPSVNVTFSQAIDPLCTYHANAALTGGSPAGGTYIGTGVTGGNSFNPSTAGVGTHNITYFYSDFTTGASGSANFSITVDACAGVNENELNRVNIYPNPSTGLFTITNVSDYQTIELVDQLGRVLNTWKVNQVVMNLDVTKIAQGNYSLVFKGQKENLVQQVQVK